MAEGHEAYHSARSERYRNECLLEGPVPVTINTEVSNIIFGNEEARKDHNYTARKMVEEQFEKVRAAEFQERPSRIRPLYGITCEECAKEFYTESTNFYLYKGAIEDVKKSCHPRYAV